MVVTLRSGKELQEREEVEKKKSDTEIEKANRNLVGCEKKKNITGLSNKNEQIKSKMKGLKRRKCKMRK